jgi:hypothetical protein
MLGGSTVAECSQFGSTSSANARKPAWPSAETTMAAK